MTRAVRLVPILLLAAACSGGAGPSRLPEVVASIDGQPITAEQYRFALDRDDREAQGLSPRTAEAITASRRQLLHALIDRHLVVRAAGEHGRSVGDDEVERALLRLKADWPGDAFEKLLADTHLTEDRLRAQLRDELLVKAYFREEVFARVAITDPELDLWLKEFGATLDRPDQVRAAQLVVKTEAAAKALQEQLRKGATFEELARRHSLSPDGKLGGDLGFFGRGQMPPQFEEVCFTLAPGRVSDVVASPYGFHLFKVLERRGAQALAPAARRAAAEVALRREKESDAQAAAMEKLRSKAVIEIDEAALQRLQGARG